MLAWCPERSEEMLLGRNPLDIACVFKMGIPTHCVAMLGMTEHWELYKLEFVTLTAFVKSGNI